jgi:hypothetical protein
MSQLNTTLKTVPAIDKQELFFISGNHLSMLLL